MEPEIAPFMSRSNFDSPLLESSFSFLFFSYPLLVFVFFFVLGRFFGSAELGSLCLLPPPCFLPFSPRFLFTLAVSQLSTFPAIFVPLSSQKVFVLFFSPLSFLLFLFYSLPLFFLTLSLFSKKLKDFSEEALDE